MCVLKPITKETQKVALREVLRTQNWNSCLYKRAAESCPQSLSFVVVKGWHSSLRGCRNKHPSWKKGELAFMGHGARQCLHFGLLNLQDYEKQVLIYRLSGPRYLMWQQGWIKTSCVSISTQG